MHVDFWPHEELMLYIHNSCILYMYIYSILLHCVGLHHYVFIIILDQDTYSKTTFISIYVLEEQFSQIMQVHEIYLQMTMQYLVCSLMDNFLNFSYISIEKNFM